MMLSKRMTAKSLELKPASQARKRMVKESSDCQPAGCDRPPDRPPPPAAAEEPLLLASAWEPLPAELAAAAAPGLCLWSGAECSAMLLRGLLAVSPPHARAGGRRRRGAVRPAPSARLGRRRQAAAPAFRGPSLAAAKAMRVAAKAVAAASRRLLLLLPSPSK